MCLHCGFRARREDATACRGRGQIQEIVWDAAQSFGHVVYAFLPASDDAPILWACVSCVRYTQWRGAVFEAPCIATRRRRRVLHRLRGGGHPDARYPEMEFVGSARYAAGPEGGCRGRHVLAEDVG